MPPKILLLEDDDDQLEVLALLISIECGRECLRSRSYDELLALGDAALACDVAFLDVNLGPAQPSGIDAYRWLLQREFKGRICFLTGHARSHPLMAQLRVLGGARVVQKPISTEALCALVRGDP